MMAAKSAAVWREVLNGECLSPVHLHSWQRCTNMNGKKKRRPAVAPVVRHRLLRHNLHAEIKLG